MAYFIYDMTKNYNTIKKKIFLKNSKKKKKKKI